MQKFLIAPRIWRIFAAARPYRDFNIAYRQAVVERSHDDTSDVRLMWCFAWHSVWSVVRDARGVEINPSSSSSSVNARSQRSRRRQTRAFNPLTGGPWPDHTSVPLASLRRRRHRLQFNRTDVRVTFWCLDIVVLYLSSFFVSVMGNCKLTFQAYHVAYRLRPYKLFTPMCLCHSAL